MQVAKRVGRYFQEARVANARAVITFAMILASAAFAAGCAGGAPEQANPDAAGSDGAPTTPERTTAEETAAAGQGDGEEARAGDALEVRAGDAEVRVGVGGVTVRAGDSEVLVGGGVVAGEGGEEATEGSANEARGGPQEVALELLGTRGTEFSGTCAVGDEEHDLGGRVPERFTYELNGRDLDCQIRKQGAGDGSLRAVLAGDGVHSVQQTDAPNATIRFSYSGRGVSSSTSSSGGSR
jgi:hypothetical protein